MQARPARVLNELAAEDFERLFALANLDWLRRDVREQSRRAVDAVGPRSPTPRGAEEIDIDEWAALGIVATDADAGIAALIGSWHAVGQHLGQCPKAAVHH